VPAGHLTGNGAGPQLQLLLHYCIYRTSGTRSTAVTCRNPHRGHHGRRRRQPGRPGRQYALV